MKNPMEGRSAKIAFDSGLEFRIDFLENNDLRWTALHEEHFGLSDVEATHVEVLGDGLISIDWIEKDGLCVSYSVDVNSQYVKSYMSWYDKNGKRGQRTYMTHEGPFYFVDEDNKPDLKPFTNLDLGKEYLANEYNIDDSKIKNNSVDDNIVYIETVDGKLYKIIILEDKSIECKIFK